MKMYKKSDLTLNNGLVVSKDGDIVLPDFRIVQQANGLETMVQKAKYLMSQPEATPMPSLDGFERMSISDNESRKFTVDTPVMDAKAEEAMKLMDEIDDVATADKANAMLDDFKSLLDFVSQDFVIDCGDQLYEFDTPVLGNVLELTEDDVVKAIAYVCGMAEEVDGQRGKKRIYGSELSDEEFDQLLGIIANHDEGFAEMIAKDKACKQNDKTDVESIVSSLDRLARGVDDLCNDIEAASTTGGNEE